MQRRLLVPIKNTVAHEARPLSCSILQQPDHSAPSIAWERNPVPLTSEDILDTRASTVDQSQAQSWLHQILADGPAPASEIIGQASDNGFGERPIRHAFAALGCLRTRRGTGLHSVWIWALPGDKQRLDEYQLDLFTESLHERDAQLQNLLESINSS